jgi:GxxExxY protein
VEALRNRAGAAFEELTGQIIKGAVAVHRALGPGLLESAYRECLVIELQSSGHSVARETTIPIVYRGKRVPGAYRADLIVDEKVVVKAAPALLPVHEAQLLTYLKLSNLRVGLLLNFNAPTLVSGLRRLVI